MSVQVSNSTNGALALTIPVGDVPTTHNSSYGVDHQDYLYEDDDGYNRLGGIPVVGVVLMVILFSAALGALIFYISYRQERGLCSKKKRSLGGEFLCVRYGCEF